MNELIVQHIEIRNALKEDLSKCIRLHEAATILELIRLIDITIADLYDQESKVA